MILARMGEHDGAFLMAAAFWIGIPAVILWFRAKRRREKDEYERKLLLENPQGWERYRQVEGEKEKQKREWMEGAAQKGIGIALQLLKKK
jgi:hypothetical protein